MGNIISRKQAAGQIRKTLESFYMLSRSVPGEGATGEKNTPELERFFILCEKLGENIRKKEYGTVLDSLDAESFRTFYHTVGKLAESYNLHNAKYFKENEPAGITDLNVVLAENKKVDKKIEFINGFHDSEFETEWNDLSERKIYILREIVLYKSPYKSKLKAVIKILKSIKPEERKKIIEELLNRDYELFAALVYLLNTKTAKSYNLYSLENNELEAKASVKRQREYLYQKVHHNYSSPQEKANSAFLLRLEMREIHPERFNIDALFYSIYGNEKFMNEDLREFLNCSDNGLPYTEKDMDPKLGWVKRTPSAAKEHQASAFSKDKQNIKYVNDTDGREAVFTYDDITNCYKLCEDKLDKGTYNYAKDTSSLLKGWTANGEHGRWDMNPYFKQFGINRLYRLIFGHIYFNFEYNINGRLDEVF